MSETEVNIEEVKTQLEEQVEKHVELVKEKVEENKEKIEEKVEELIQDFTNKTIPEMFLIILKQQENNVYCKKITRWCYY